MIVPFNPIQDLRSERLRDQIRTSVHTQTLIDAAHSSIIDGDLKVPNSRDDFSWLILLVIQWWFNDVLWWFYGGLMVVYWWFYGGLMVVL